MAATPSEKSYFLDLVKIGQQDEATSALHRLKDRFAILIGGGAFIIGLFLGLLIK